MIYKKSFFNKKFDVKSIFTEQYKQLCGYELVSRANVIGTLLIEMPKRVFKIRRAKSIFLCALVLRILFVFAAFKLNKRPLCVCVYAYVN